MSEYTPTTEFIRATFLDPSPWANPDRAGADFDAWLAEERRAAAEKALEPVRALHRRGTVYSHEDSCPDSTDEHRENHHLESPPSGEFYCDQMPEYDICIECSESADPDQEWPCPTIRAIEAKETKA